MLLLFFSVLLWNAFRCSEKWQGWYKDVLLSLYANSPVVHFLTHLPLVSLCIRVFVCLYLPSTSVCLICLSFLSDSKSQMWGSVIPTRLCQRLWMCVRVYSRKLPLIREYYVAPKPHLNIHNIIYSNRQKGGVREAEAEEEEEEEEEGQEGEQECCGEGREGGELHWEKHNFCWRNSFKVKSFIQLP